MRTKLSLFISALLLMAGALVATSSGPAWAVTCNSGTLCFADNVDGTAVMYAPRVSDTPRTRCIALPASANNKTSHIRNRSEETLLVYTNGTCSSEAGIIHPLSSGPMGGVWVNSISSWCRCG